jgi:hypothetical protein
MKYSEYYYEIECADGGVIAFEELEDAIEYADETGATMISQIGGSFTDFEKCAFCGEWFDCCELNEYGDCPRCEQAIKDHGGY